MKTILNKPRDRWAFMSLVGLLVILVAAPFFVAVSPFVGKAIGYGGSYADSLRRCKSGCDRKGKILLGCAKKSGHQALKVCREIYAEDRLACLTAAIPDECFFNIRDTLRACRNSARANLRADTRYIKDPRGGGYRNKKKSSRNFYGSPGGLPGCTTCCDTSLGRANCNSEFQSSRWYGSSRGVCRSQTYHGSPSGAFVGATARVREGLAKLVPWLTQGW